MSKNIRYRPSKSPSRSSTSTKKTRTATSTDSDSDYDGVDLVDDSEEDDKDVLAAEEEAMLQPSGDESDDDEDFINTIPHHDDINDDAHEAWEGFTLEADTTGNAPYFGDDIDALTPYLGDTAEEIATGRRRVHWDSDGDDSEDSQVYDDMFPDIFVDQDHLDPVFRQEIEKETNDMYEDESDDDASFQGWGVGPEAGKLAEQDEPESQDGTSSDDYSSSSGYESAGETTDEDTSIPAMITVVPTKEILRRVSTDSSSLSELDEDQITKPAPRVRTPYTRRGPILANWLTDPKRPYAFVDEKKKKMVVVKNRNHNILSTPLRAIPPSDHLFDYTPVDSPLINTSGDVMFGGLCPLDSINGGAAIGPPEAFYPFVNINADGTQSLDEHSSFEDEYLDDTDMYNNFDELIDFGDDYDDSTAQDDGDDDEDDNENSDELTEENRMTTPSRPARSRSGSRATTMLSEGEVHPLLEHFERNPVGAFRSNQTRHALISRNRVTKESLGFAGPYGAPIRGIKHDRMAAANAPITPARRPKQPKMSITPSPAIANPNSKRRMSNNDLNSSHKRNKISV